MKGKLTSFALLMLAALMAPGAEPACAASWDRGMANDIGRPIQQAGARRDQDNAREAVRQGRILPLGKVLSKVQASYPGRLLDAELVEGRGPPVYLIKLMTRDGNVAIVAADAASGRVLSYRHGGR